MNEYVRFPLSEDEFRIKPGTITEFFGPRRVGKTTIAAIIAHEASKEVIQTKGDRTPGSGNVLWCSYEGAKNVLNDVCSKRMLTTDPDPSIDFIPINAMDPYHLIKKSHYDGHNLIILDEVSVMKYSIWNTTFSKYWNDSISSIKEYLITNGLSLLLTTSYEEIDGEDNDTLDFKSPLPLSLLHHVENSFYLTTGPRQRRELVNEDGSTMGNRWELKAYKYDGLYVGSDKSITLHPSWFDKSSAKIYNLQEIEDFNNG